MNISRNCIFLNESFINLKKEKYKIYNEAMEIAKKEAIEISKKIQNELLKELNKNKIKLKIIKIENNIDELTKKYNDGINDSIIILRYCTKYIENNEEYDDYLEKCKEYFDLEEKIISKNLENSNLKYDIDTDSNANSTFNETFIFILFRDRAEEIYKQLLKERKK